MIDELRVADVVAAAALSAAFGWPHRREDWALFMRVGQGAAWREAGRLCGTAMWFPLGPDHASIGLVQVAPDLQGRGIGKRLMNKVMEQAAPRNLMLNATKEGAGLYAALGFARGGIVQQWQGPCEHRTSREPERADRAVVLRLDEAATGLARGAVLDALLEDSAVIVGPEGYAMRRVFGRGSVIGPVIANDTATALALVRALTMPGLIRIDVPADKRDIPEALGLACVDEVQTMTTGDWPPAPRIFALAAQSLG